MGSTYSKRQKLSASDNGDDNDNDHPSPLPNILAFILPWLNPVEIVRLSAASKEIYGCCSDDGVWAPWLAKINALDHSSVLTRLQKANVPSLMLAYMAAMTARCADCQGWAGFLNILQLKPQCHACCKTWCEADGVVYREDAERVYALTKDDMTRLPCAGHHYASREQAEALALQRYGSVEALMQEKRERKRIVEAEFSYKKAMHDLKVKAAKACGVRGPNHLHTPPIISEPVMLDWNRIGNKAIDHLSQPWTYVLMPVPFPAKHDPTVNAITGALANRVFICQYCKGRLRNWDSDKHLRRYPSAALCMREHELSCPHRHG